MGIRIGSDWRLLADFAGKSLSELCMEVWKCFLVEKGRGVRAALRMCAQTRGVKEHSKFRQSGNSVWFWCQCRVRRAWSHPVVKVVVGESLTLSLGLWRAHGGHFQCYRNALGNGMCCRKACLLWMLVTSSAQATLRRTQQLWSAFAFTSACQFIDFLWQM